MDVFAETTPNEVSHQIACSLNFQCYNKIHNSFEVAAQYSTDARDTVYIL